MILMHSGNVPEPNIPSSKTLNNRGGDLQFSLPPPSPFLPFARVAKLIWGFCGCWVRADQRWTEKGTTCVGGPAYVGRSVGRSLGGCGLPLLSPSYCPSQASLTTKATVWNGIGELGSRLASIPPSFRRREGGGRKWALLSRRLRRAKPPPLPLHPHPALLGWKEEQDEQRKFSRLLAPLCSSPPSLLTQPVFDCGGSCFRF